MTDARTNAARYLEPITPFDLPLQVGLLNQRYGLRRVAPPLSLHEFAIIRVPIRVLYLERFDGV